MKTNWLQICAYGCFAISFASFIHFVRVTSLARYHFGAIIIAFSLVYVFYESYWKRTHLPPGPRPLLLAGNMLDVLLNPNIDALFLKWRQKYGGIFTFWMGPIPMVMVADTDIMKRYFIKNADIFSSRWRNFITETLLDGFNGVVQIDGEKWREQRRFSLHVLRDFGVGRAIMEEKIIHQVDILMNHINNYADTQKTIDMSVPLSVCVGNIINDVLFGKTFHHNDPEFRLLNEMLDKQSSLVLKPIMGLYLVAPWTTSVPFVNASWLELIEIRNTLWNFLGKQLQVAIYYNVIVSWAITYVMEIMLSGFSLAKIINCNKKSYHNTECMYLMGIILAWSPLLTILCFAIYAVVKLCRDKRDHKKAFNTDKEPSDFTYTYLKEMFGILFEMNLSEKQLLMLLLDLFFAGMETTVTTSKWGILMLVLHPEVQKRAQEELDRFPTRILLQDRSKLTYVQAVINEIQRVANILPINLLRTVAETIEIDGFRFPAGTMVLPQISIAMNDPSNFENPGKFNPDRFIDENFNLKKYDAFLPFSIGKRQCLGEALAKAELFLIFANLLRNFEFCMVESEPPPSRARIYGLTVSPKKYQCIVKRRHC